MESLRSLQASPSRLALAASVHIFTALGAVFGLLALLSAARADWKTAFAWLGIALIVDGADGPLARRFQVTEVLPRFSGKDLDNVVDYLNYVIVPAFILARSEVLPATVALPAAIAMALTSLYHFADNDSKTDAGQFVGFPAIWNIVVFYFFITGLPQWGAAAIVMLCASLTFVRLYWVHPFRYRRLRPLTAIVILAWGVAAIAALFGAFPSHDAIRAIFWIAAAYILALGFGSSLLARSRG